MTNLVVHQLHAEYALGDRSLGEAAAAAHTQHALALFLSYYLVLNSTGV